MLLAVTNLSKRRSPCSKILFKQILINNKQVLVASFILNARVIWRLIMATLHIMALFLTQLMALQVRISLISIIQWIKQMQIKILLQIYHTFNKENSLKRAKSIKSMNSKSKETQTLIMFKYQGKYLSQFNNKITGHIPHKMSTPK